VASESRTLAAASADREDAAIDLSDYEFDLPSERIAQAPALQRDASRLLVLDRNQPGPLRHASFSQFPDCLEAGDLLVLNATRVQPARLRGRRESGGAVEVLLLAPVLAAPDSVADSAAANDAAANDAVANEVAAETAEGELRFRALVKLSGRLRPGIRMTFGPEARRAEITQLGERGEVVIAFEPGASPYSLGEPPLPPYIRRPGGIRRPGDGRDETAALDRERYQTIYARVPGAIAAPTAGLHFSEAIFEALAARGVERREVVLHVGPGTFRPLDDEALRSGRLHRESFELPQSTARAVAETKARGGRVVAVGTTSARVLEACARRSSHPTQLEPGRGETDIFLRPGSKFQVVDALLTNFHLPRSSLLLLVAAFAGRERILAAYREAVAREYRFFSYGDAMLIL